MIVIINKNNVEQALILADNKLNEVIISDNVNYPNYKCSNDLVEYDEDNMLVYKSEIQKVFDYWFNYFYTEISK